MIRVRSILVSALAGLLLVAGFVVHTGAQTGGFEGVISLTISAGAKPTSATAYVKGERLRMETEVAGIPGALISDGKGNMIMLISPMKQYTVMNVKSMMEASGAAQGTLQFAKTGRRETIVGQACEYHTMTRSAGKDAAMGEACVTTEMGFVGLNVGGRGSGMLSPADDAALRKQFPSGFLILKQMGPDGRLLYEVTKVAKQPVADSMFEPPAGYSEMKMPIGMPPPGE